MHKYRIIFGIVAFLAMSPALQAQVDPSLDQLRTVIPPSPNVSALGKFGDWPVGLFTGVPSIDIPIYELKGRSLSVPISIDYHAAGNRVGETASSVGLGWALNAGGCISRTIQGLPDEDGYLTTASNYTNPNNFCNGAINSATLTNDVLAAVQGEQDTQEDIYNLSAMGKSYRIYINAANDSAYTMPTSSIRISRNFLQNTNADSSTWSVILEDGTKLIFGGVNPGNYVEQTSNSTLGIGNYVSAWYLQSIQSVTGEVIIFTYTPSTIYQPVHFTQTDYISYVTASSSTVAEMTNSPATSTRGSFNTITQLSLSTIESDLTRVYFIPSTTARTDLSGGYALSEIKVLSKLNGAYIEDWLFNDYYTTAASGNAAAPAGPVSSSYYTNRLKLGSLTRVAMDASGPQIWTFGYNPLSLPSQTSFAQDYWGFYNGATSNVSLLPNIPFNGADCTVWPGSYTGSFVDGLTLTYFINEGFMPPNHDIGNSRLANETYMQAEILNKITYPTGGYTVFNYEANKQPVSEPVLAKANTTYLALNLTSSSTYTPTQSFQFTTTAPEYIQINLTSYISPAIIQDFPAAQVAVSVQGVGNGFSWTSDAGSVSQYLNLYLPGTYNFLVSTNCASDEFTGTNDVIASAGITYNASLGTQTVNQYFGGLRINNIQSFDGISPTPVMTKYYTYASPFVINPVDTVNDFITTQNSVAIGSNGATVYSTNVTRNASTKYALGSIQGGTVGYGQVTTLDGLNGANGYTVSTFRTDAASQANPASLVFPYPPSDPHTWRSGVLLAESTYTASGVPVKSTSNNYNFVNPFTITNTKYATSTAYSGSSITQTQVLSGITTMCFSLTNEQVEKTSSTETTYDQSTGNALSTTTNYYYDDPANMQPVRTVTVDSKGDTVLTYARTALEEPAINSSIPLTATAITALNTMVANNMVAQPVESEQYIKGVLMKKGLTNYKVEPNGFVQPDNVMIQTTTNPIETRLQFNRYDPYGNLVQQQRDNDAFRTFIWDYQHQYPIAQCVNADSVDLAYSSFEADGSGTWTIPSTARDTGSITGSSCYNLSNGAITRGGLTSTKNYIVSFWARTSSSVTLTGGSGAVTGKTIAGWTYHEYTLTGATTATVSGSGDIDELRLYPSTAQLTTYTYSPLVGMTSQCDVDNRVTYYLYDGLKRLSFVKDQDQNVLKRYCYNYSGQTQNCFLQNYPVGVIVTNNSTVATYVTLTNTATQQSYTFNAAAGTTAVQVGQVLPGTYTISMGLSSPSSSYFISYTIGANTQTNCVPVTFSNFAINAPVTIVMNHIASVAVNASDGTNQNITMSFAGTLGTYGFSAAPGNNGLAGYIPVGTYTVLIQPSDSFKSYPINYTVNGSTLMNWQSQSFPSANYSSTVTLSANAPASVPVLVQNTTNLTITSSFINSFGDTINFTSAPGTNGTVGYVPQVVYNISMSPPTPVSNKYPIVFTVNGNTQTLPGPATYNAISLPGSANLIAAPVPTVNVNSADGSNKNITEVFTNTWNGQFTFTAAPGNNGLSGTIPQGAYNLTITPTSPIITYPILWSFNGTNKYYYNAVTYGNLSITGAVSVSANVPPNISVVASNSGSKAITIWLVDVNSGYTYGNYTSASGTSNINLATIPSGQYQIFISPGSGNTTTFVYSVNGGTPLTSTGQEEFAGTYTGTINISIAP